MLVPRSSCGRKPSTRVALQRDTFFEVLKRTSDACFPLIMETRWEGVDWMHLAQDRDKWWVLVNMVMNFQVFHKWWGVS
jgi:hypothetical protein